MYMRQSNLESTFQGDVVDPDPLPLLLWDNIANAVVHRPGCPNYRVPVLEEILQGGGGGSGAKDSAGVRTPDPVDSDAEDALFVEGPVDRRRDVCDFVVAELRALVVHELAAPLIHRRLGRRRLLL